MAEWMNAGWAGFVLPSVLVAVWLGLWWVRRRAMAWFFAGALAVSVASCPAGFVTALFDTAECPSDAQRLSSESWCLANDAMTIWTNTFWAMITCAVLGAVTLLVVGAQAGLRRARRM